MDRVLHGPGIKKLGLANGPIGRRDAALKSGARRSGDVCAMPDRAEPRCEG